MEKVQLEADISRYQALLKESNFRRAEHENFAAKLGRATKQRAAWNQRCRELEAMLASIEVGIKKVCACKEKTSTSSSQPDTNSQQALIQTRSPKRSKAMPSSV
jgi:hypothetical protein